MTKTILESTNYFEGMIVLKTDQYFTLIKPESIVKINIHIKTGLISITCADKTEYVVEVEGLDNRIIGLLVERGIIRVDNDGDTNREDNGDKTTK